MHQIGRPRVQGLDAEIQRIGHRGRGGYSLSNEKVEQFQQNKYFSFDKWLGH